MVLEPIGVPVTDGCEIIGCGPTKMYEYINEGAVRTYKIGRARRIYLDSLRDLAKRLEEGAA